MGGERRRTGWGRRPRALGWAGLFFLKAPYDDNTRLVTRTGADVEGREVAGRRSSLATLSSLNSGRTA